MSLLEVKNLSVRIYTNGSYVEPISNASFSLNSHQALGIVGESGCGKTMLALSIMRLLPRPGGKIVGGEILWNDNDLVKLPEKEMRKVRGKDISLVFQEPMTAMNPIMKIGKQIGETISAHERISKQKIESRVHELLGHVGITDAKERSNSYPHQLSGGMRQRAMIAEALACEPKLLLADEPTTALDVTIQAQILDLLASLRKEHGMSLMLVTHDFGVVSEMTENVIVMYAGEFVEEGSTQDVFLNPLHPYTQGLLKSLPNKKGEKLYTIPGRVPELSNLPKGCRFADRCCKVKKECREEKIEYKENGEGRLVRCLFPGE